MDSTGPGRGKGLPIYMDSTGPGQAWVRDSLYYGEHWARPGQASWGKRVRDSLYRQQWARPGQAGVRDLF